MYQNEIKLKFLPHPADKYLMKSGQSNPKTNPLCLEEVQKILEEFFCNYDLSTSFLDPQSVLSNLKKSKNPNLFFKTLVKEIITNDISLFASLNEICKMPHELYDFYLNHALFLKKEDAGLKNVLDYFQPPQSYFTKDRILKMLFIDGTELSSFRKTPFIQDPDVCFQAIINAPTDYVANYIPDSVWNEDFVKKCFEVAINKTNYQIVSVVTENYPLEFNVGLLLPLIETNSLYLQYIPEAIQFEELCFKAVLKNPASIKHIKKPTLDMYLEAVSQDKRLTKSTKYYNEHFNSNEEKILEAIVEYKKRRYLLENL